MSMFLVFFKSCLPIRTLSRAVRVSLGKVKALPGMSCLNNILFLSACLPLGLYGKPYADVVVA